MQIDFQSKKMTIILGGIMGVLILLIAVISYFLLVPSNNIKVIDFTDMPLTEVHQWLEDNKVDEELYQVSYEYNETIEKEHVASQNLKEGEVITKEEILKLVVSNGYDPDLEVDLIDFTNKTEDEVMAWFSENKFSDVSVEYVLDDKIEKDKFVKLNIKENKAKRSDLIMVSISAGKDAIGLEITMPDFKDYTRENIQAWAKTNLITLTISEESSDTIESGKLISQNPKAGSKIKTGDKASVTISIGKGVKAVSQIGKTQANAIKWAKDNGLKYSIVEYYSDKTKGNVISQSVTSGSLKPGATISFGVSVGKIPVANFTGKAKDEFIQHVNGLNTLYNKSAKLSLAVKEEDSQQATGTILSITVNGVKVEDTLMVSPGSNITMVVSKGKSVDIKDQSGKSENEFLQYLKDNGMVVGSKTQRYHDTIGANLIISSDAGVKLQGSSVNYTVSLGAFALDANLYAAGKSYSALKDTIDQANNLGAGWSISMTEVETTDLDKGLIRSCSINGKTVTCEVSKGVFKYVTVPDLKGQDSPCGEEEKCSVGGINYTIQFQNDYNESVAYGKVVSNDKAGEKVLEGTSVNVVLSRGPKPKPQCPADSTGEFAPDCKCNNEMYDYDSSSNTCKLARATTPDVTTFNLISGGNGTPQEKAAKAEQELRNRGFTNVKTEYQASNDTNGLITGLNVEYKKTYSINEPIIIYITVMS